jgi:hypothetical protein
MESSVWMKPKASGRSLTVGDYLLLTPFFATFFTIVHPEEVACTAVNSAHRPELLKREE